MGVQSKSDRDADNGQVSAQTRADDRGGAGNDATAEDQGETVRGPVSKYRSRPEV